MARYSGHSGYERTDAAEPFGPEPLGWQGYGSCLFCGSRGTHWQHDLDRALVEFRTRFDRGHSWGSAQVLCDDCEQRYRRGDYFALARRRAVLNPGGFASDQFGTEDGAADAYAQSLLIQDELISLAAFCRADLRARKLVAPGFPDGFEPVAEHTGAEWVVDVWPAEFRMSVAETRPGHLENDPSARIWLLSSPWSSLSLAETFGVLWTWAESFRDEQTTEQIRGRIVEALAWTDVQAVHWLAGQ